MHTNQHSIEFLSMHFKSWRPFKNIVSAHISSRPALYGLIKLYVSHLFVYMTKCLLQKFIKTKTGVVVESHRACDNSEHIGKKLVFDRQQRLWFSNDDRIPRIGLYCYRSQKLYALSKPIFLTFGMHFFKNLKTNWNQDRRAYPSSSWDFNIYFILRIYADTTVSATLTQR